MALAWQSYLAGREAHQRTLVLWETQLACRIEDNPFANRLRCFLCSLLDTAEKYACDTRHNGAVPADWFSPAIAHPVVGAGESDCIKSVREKFREQ
jgi:hypothetical protein